MTKGVLSRKDMGGIIATQGFAYQNYWILLSSLNWLGSDDFDSLLQEGADDVDVLRRDEAGAPPRRIRYQLKSFRLTPSDLSKILEGFRDADAEYPGTWAEYRVVAPSCSNDLISLSRNLDRVRGVAVGYRGTSYLEASLAELGRQLERLKLPVEPSFLVEKVHLEFDVNWPNRDEFARSLVETHVRSLQVPPQKALATVRALWELVTTRIGKKLTKTELKSCLANFQEKTLVTIRRPAARTAPETLAHSNFMLVVFPGSPYLLRLPTGGHALIDCGRRSVDACIHYLVENSVSELEFVTISHWHSDHYAGLPRLLRTIDAVGDIYVPPRASAGSRRAREVFDRLSSVADRIVEFGGIRTVFSRGVFRVDAIGPPSAIVARAEQAAAERPAHEGHALRQDLNESCAVLSVESGGTRFLFPADATIREWMELARDPNSRERLLCDGMVLPRHGSRHSFSEEVGSLLVKSSGFLSIVEPYERFRLPHEEVMSVVREMGAEILSCQDRPVFVMVDERGIWTRSAPVATGG